MPNLRNFLFYEEPGITLYCGDCREVLPLIGGGIVLLTDPPYGHGARWNGGTWAAKPMYEVDVQKWDSQPFPDKDLLLMVNRFNRAIVWGGQYYDLPPRRGWLIWEKSSKMPTLADAELAWTTLDQPTKMWRDNRNADGARWHPTQKPVALMQWCLSFAEGDVVDPFCGSGTSLLAAKNLGRRAVGIEIEPKYCEIAVRRLRQEVLPLGGVT